MNGHHQGEMLQLHPNLERREEKGMERVKHECHDSLIVIISTCQVNKSPGQTKTNNKYAVFDPFMGFVGYNKSSSLIL